MSLNPTQILFDPNQFKEFGLKYFEGDNYTVRFQYRSKLFWNSIYVPYGPNCLSYKGLDNFLTTFCAKKLSRIRIDLPLILDQKLKISVKEKFLKNGFKEMPYVQDEETILIVPENAKLDNKEIRYYRRKAEVNYEFSVLKNLSSEQIDQIYEIYLDSAKRIGYIPKDKSVLEILNQNSLVGVSINKKSGKIHAFVWGFVYDLYSDFEKGETKKVLEIVFIGTNEESRQSYVGYGMHQQLFKSAFEDEKIDIINFRGASRTHDRKYLSFKKSFGGEFVPFAGGYEKVNLV